MCIMIPYVNHLEIENSKYVELLKSIMSKICQITQKGTHVAGKYSNRVRATQFNPTGKTRKKPNIQKKRIFIPELNKTVTVEISTKGLKTIQKNGAYKTLKAAGLI